MQCKCTEPAQKTKSIYYFNIKIKRDDCDLKDDAFDTHFTAAGHQFDGGLGDFLQ